MAAPASSTERRGIELLPPVTPTGRGKLISLWARRAGIPLIIFFQLAFLTVLGFRLKLEADLQKLAASLVEKEKVVAEARSFEETFRRTQRKLEKIGQIRQELCYSCTIQKLNEIKPSEVTLTNLHLENEKLEVVAETPQGITFAIFADSIIREEWIREAVLTSGNLNREGNFVFTIELGVDKKGLR
uniref:PilN domain-containing protein n=1 Tax=candidate division WWE3 bacterium TaxID=2053526 RepID=A0A831Z2U7_UNCKA